MIQWYDYFLLAFLGINIGLGVDKLIRGNFSQPSFSNTEWAMVYFLMAMFDTLYLFRFAYLLTHNQ